MNNKIKQLIKLGKEVELQIEVNSVLDDLTSINTLNDRITKFEISKINVFNIKAIKDGRCASITTENINKPKNLINEILSIFETSDNDNKNELANDNISSIINKDIIDYNQVKKDLLSLNDLHSMDSRLRDFEINYCHYHGIEKIINHNSNMTDSSTYHEFGSSLTAIENGITKIIYFNYITKKYDFEGFKNLYKEKIGDVLFKLNDDSIKTDTYDIIIKNTEIVSILMSFLAMFDSKSIYMHQSILEGKLGKKVFSDKLTIVEDPTNGQMICQSLFDNEGTRTAYKKLIDKGVFTKKINDIEYALKLNEPRTGNASGVNNLYIIPGSLSYDELVKKMNNGIIIDSLSGLHAGINQETGNISLQAEGVLIRDGKKINALSLIILSTNIMTLLNNISEIGNDLLFSDVSCGAPSILFNNITITGKK